MSGPVVLVLRLILAFSLYAFLGLVLWSLWRDIRQQGALLAARKVPGINLTIHDGKTTTRHFSQPEITLGRDPHCEVILEDVTVSSCHARLSHHHGQWWLEDLGSTNGTCLNDEYISTPTVIISGDRVSCGEATLTLNLSADATLPLTHKT